MKDANSDKVLDNPAFVEWAPYLVNVKSVGDTLKETYTALKYRKCNEDDWKEFDKPPKSSEGPLAKFRKQELFYCLTGQDSHGNEI